MNESSIEQSFDFDYFKHQTCFNSKICWSCFVVHDIIIKLIAQYSRVKGLVMLKGVRRSKKIGKKKVLFFVRHENDLDFLLPVLFSACKPIVMIWGSLADDDFRLKMLRDNGIIPVFLEGRTVSLIQKILLRLPLVGKSTVCRKYVNNKNSKLLVRNFKDRLGSLQKDLIDYVVFDHTVNATVEKIISALREWKTEICIFSFPHGRGIVGNRMYKYNLLRPPRMPNWDIFDKLIVFNEHHNALFNLDKRKKETIPSLRDTKEWLTVLCCQLKKYGNYLPNDEKGNKNRLLIIHSRLSGNINYNELVRCIKILDLFDSFDVRVKPHPRRKKDAYDLVKMSHNVSIINFHITECIRWADYVMFFGSSAVYDALNLGKPVFYPDYMLSNKLDDNILKYFHVLNTPDEFYELIENLDSSNCPETLGFTPVSWDETVDRWAELLN